MGGLGLGYTARAALEDARVQRLWVVEAMDAVIDWHVTGLLPLSAELTDDPRCQLVLGDFFALVADGEKFADEPLLDAILLDIDHTPEHVLHPSHADFYSRAGLQTGARAAQAGRGVRAVVGRAAFGGFPGAAAGRLRQCRGAPRDVREPVDRRGVVQLGLRRDQLTLRRSADRAVLVVPLLLERVGLDRAQGLVTRAGLERQVCEAEYLVGELVDGPALQGTRLRDRDRGAR